MRRRFFGGACGLLLATLGHAAAARAGGGASCPIPDALLHDPCVSSLVVHLASDASCRVSFRQICPGVEARAALLPHDRSASPPGRQIVSPPCFQFNGRTVCE